MTDADRAPTAPDPSPTPDPATPRVALVVDDHPITHLGCGRLLAELGYGRVLKAMTGAEALAALETEQPSVVVLDIALPDAPGLTLIAPIRERAPEAMVLVFSMNDQPGFAARALAEGAQGFLSKNAAPEEFATAIRALEAGEYYLSPAVALALATRQAGAGRRAELTEREEQVLALIGAGRSLQQIADEIGISYKTVANTSSTLKRKLNVTGMPGLVREALEREGLG